MNSNQDFWLDEEDRIIEFYNAEKPFNASLKILPEKELQNALYFIRLGAKPRRSIEKEELFTFLFHKRNETLKKHKTFIISALNILRQCETFTDKANTEKNKNTVYSKVLKLNETIARGYLKDNKWENTIHLWVFYIDNIGYHLRASDLPIMSVGEGKEILTNIDEFKNNDPLGFHKMLYSYAINLLGTFGGVIILKDVKNLSLEEIYVKYLKHYWSKYHWSYSDILHIYYSSTRLLYPLIIDAVYRSYGF